MINRDEARSCFGIFELLASATAGRRRDIDSPYLKRANAASGRLIAGVTRDATFLVRPARLRSPSFGAVGPEPSHGLPTVAHALSWQGERRLVRPEGLEPPAYRFEACRSIQLSYGRTED